MDFIDDLLEEIHQHVTKEAVPNCSRWTMKDWNTRGNDQLSGVTEGSSLGQWHRWALVHLEEFESAESAAERTMSGHEENEETISNRCTCDCGERQTIVSSYDMWWCPQLHVDRPGYPNPCRCQLWQTLGGIYLKKQQLSRTRRRKIKMCHAALSSMINTKSLYVAKWAITWQHLKQLWFMRHNIGIMLKYVYFF